jgi:DNA modification methylase
VQLLRYLVEAYTKEGDLVFDPFAGSGTTAIACQQLKL